MLFNRMWYETRDVPGLEDIRGEWVPMPIGCRVAYSPKKDAIQGRAKISRFDGYVRTGFMLGYAQDLRPRRGYVILDESDLIVRGTPRFVVADQVRMLTFKGAPIFPFRHLTGAQLRRANEGLKGLLPAKLRNKRAAAGSIGALTMSPAPPEWSQGVFDESDEGEADPDTLQGACADNRAEMLESMRAQGASAKQQKKALRAHKQWTHALDPGRAPEDETYIVEPFSETVMVTEVISRRDPRYVSQGAQAARRKEVATLDQRQFAKWASARGKRQWRESKGAGTWSRSNMLTAQKNTENFTLPPNATPSTYDYHDCEFKGRLVLCGNEQIDCDGIDRVPDVRKEIQETGLSVCPLQNTELRTMFVIEAADAAANDYELAVFIADEDQAYTSTRRGDFFPALPEAVPRADALELLRPHLPTRIVAGEPPQTSFLMQPRYMLITAKDLDWVPDEHKAFIKQLLDASPEGVLVELDVMLYGGLESGFYYEAKRNRNFDKAGAERKPGTSLYRYSAPKQGGRCSAGAFIDDHVVMGNLSTASTLCASLESIMTYKNGGFRRVALREMAVYVGIELLLYRTPDAWHLQLTQTAYGRLWLGRVETMVEGTGLKLKHRTTPAWGEGRMLPPTDQQGLLASVARAANSAMAFAARHTVPELIEPSTFLSTKYNAWTAHEDNALLWSYGYWLTILDNEADALTLTVGIEDAKAGTLYHDFYSDADHASTWTRRSTSGANSIVVGEERRGVEVTRALLTEGSKGQPGIAKSSGDAEVKAIDEILKAYNAEPTTELELELMRSAAPKSKAAVSCVTRIIYPVSQLIDWMQEGRTVVIRSRYLHVDASVAISVANSGSSRNLAYLAKSQCVDLRWLHDSIGNYGILLRKVASARNTSDVFTKAVTRAVLEKILPMLGRGARYAPMA